MATSMRYTKDEWKILRDMADRPSWKRLWARGDTDSIRATLNIWRSNFLKSKRLKTVAFYDDLIGLLFRSKLEDVPLYQGKRFMDVYIKWRYTIGK